VKKKNLLIFYSQNNYKINKKYDHFINLGDGNLEIANSKEISLKKYYKKNYNYFKKKLVTSLYKKILYSKGNSEILSELEIFNLRNDKINNIDLIINLLIIKKVIKKLNINNLILITDNQLIQKIITRIYPKVEIIDHQKKKLRLFPFLKISKFYFKAFFVIIMIKCLSNNKLLKRGYPTACFSLAPIFYKNRKEKFFRDEKNLKLNFLLTDETHLNFSVLDIYKILKNQYKNLVHVESAISFKDLTYGLIKSYSFLYFINNSNMKLNIDNLDFSEFYKEYLTISAINRSKLNIYNKAIPNLFKKFQITNFKMYLFEYNFGFYINKLIRRNLKQIDITGYQHGIFSDKLMWFDIYTRNKKNFKYLPNKVISFNLQSLKDYKKILPKGISFKLTQKPKSKISILFKPIKKNNSQKHILILPGTHDAKTIYGRFKNRILNFYNPNEIYYFKFHPKNKIVSKDFKNLKIIETTKNKRFNLVLISSTSTLVYDFYKLNKNIMVYDINNKQNLISSGLLNKIKFFEI